MNRPRFTVRTIMIAVAVFALLLAAIGPARVGYRRWSYYHAHAANYRRLERSEMLRGRKEVALADDREAIRAGLKGLPEFAAKSEPERETMIDSHVAFHRTVGRSAIDNAERVAEQRRASETAAFWAPLDPFGPEVP